MIRIGDVWDSSTDVLAGRAGLLAPVALLAFVLPQAVQAAIKAYGGPSSGIAVLSFVVALVVLAMAIWGQLTVIGVASDPGVTRAQAGRAALARLGPAALVTLVLAAVALAAVLPLVVALLASGYDFEAAAAQAGSASPQPVPPGTALFVILYSLLLFGAALWVGARLFLLNPVVLMERQGIGAIRRSFALTRGLTLRLIGVSLVLAGVYIVAALATQAVVFVVFRLLLGPANIATAAWLGAVAAALVLAAFSVVVGVFAARLYAAVAGPKAVAPQ